MSDLNMVEDIGCSFAPANEPMTSTTENASSYAGELGAAIIVSRFAAGGLLPKLRRAVGFDSGDYAEITAAR